MNNIEATRTAVDEAMKAVATRAFKASQMPEDWPETLKLAALDSEFGEVPSWNAAVDAYGAARELKGHVDICIEVLMEDGISWLCGGQRGYCPKAPKQP